MFSNHTTMADLMYCVILTNTSYYVDGMPDPFNMFSQLIVLHLFLYVIYKIIFLTLTTTKDDVV